MKETYGEIKLVELGFEVFTGSHRVQFQTHLRYEDTKEEDIGNR